MEVSDGSSKLHEASEKLSTRRLAPPYDLVWGNYLYKAMAHGVSRPDGGRNLRELSCFAE